MNVVVVDDEYYARKALVKVLEKLEINLEVVADLETGRDAVEFLQTHPEVDTVITDIRMPEMDGLQLAEYIHRERPSIDVIIETGYSDFKYARQAMQYSVRDYITKPINRDELKKALVNIIENRKRKFQEMQKQLEKSIVEFTCEQLSMKELNENQELQQQFMKNSLHWAEELPYHLILLQCEKSLSWELKEDMKRLLADRLEGTTSEMFYFAGNQEFVILYFQKKAEDPSHVKAFCASLLSHSKESSGLSVTISVSRQHTGMKEVYGAYKEAVYAISLRLLQGWNKVYQYNPEKESTSLSQAEEMELQKALVSLDYNAAKKIIHEVFTNPDLIHNGDFYALYNRIINILGILNQQYNHQVNRGAVSKERMMFLFSRRYDLYNFRHVSELEEYLLGIVQEICCQEQEEKGSDIIQKIIDYISRSYQYDISLQDLAEKKYFMNASYLSRLFKAAKGKTFSKYLIEYRLEKSKELLEKTILKVSDIAVHVGYNDVSHYIQSFRKMYGITPEEYRSHCTKTDSE